MNLYARITLCRRCCVVGAYVQYLLTLPPFHPNPLSATAGACPTTSKKSVLCTSSISKVVTKCGQPTHCEEVQHELNFLQILYQVYFHTTCVFFFFLKWKGGGMHKQGGSIATMSEIQSPSCFNLFSEDILTWCAFRILYYSLQQ